MNCISEFCIGMGLTCPHFLGYSLLGKGHHFLKFESHSVENESLGEHDPTVLGISPASLPPAAYPTLQTSFEDRSMCERVEERLSWLWKLHFGYRRLYWGGGRNLLQPQPSNAYSFHLIKKIVLNFHISKIKDVFLHNHKIIITPRVLIIDRYYYLIYKSHLISPTVLSSILYFIFKKSLPILKSKQ